MPFGGLILSLSLSLISRSMKSRILTTYPDAFPSDSTGEVVDRKPDLEMPNISQAVHKLQHVSRVPIGKHNLGKESPPPSPTPLRFMNTM